MDGINSKLDTTEELTNEPDKIETHRKNTEKKMREPSDLWGNIKWSKIHVIWVSEKWKEILQVKAVKFTLLPFLSYKFFFKKINISPINFISCYVSLLYLKWMPVWIQMILPVNKYLDPISVIVFHFPMGWSKIVLVSWNSIWIAKIDTYKHRLPLRLSEILFWCMGQNVRLISPLL